MSRKRKQVRRCALICYVCAALLFVEAAWVIVIGPVRWLVLPLMALIVLALAAARWLPLALKRYGEDHWLLDWAAFREKVLRRP
jgi:hypothetical protein